MFLLSFGCLLETLEIFKKFWCKTKLASTYLAFFCREDIRLQLWVASQPDIVKAEKLGKQLLNPMFCLRFA